MSCHILLLVYYCQKGAPSIRGLAASGRHLGLIRTATQHKETAAATWPLLTVAKTITTLSNNHVITHNNLTSHRRLKSYDR